MFFGMPSGSADFFRFFCRLFNNGFPTSISKLSNNPKRLTNETYYRKIKRTIICTLLQRRDASITNEEKMVMEAANAGR